MHAYKIEALYEIQCPRFVVNATTDGEAIAKAREVAPNAITIEILSIDGVPYGKQPVWAKRLAWGSGMHLNAPLTGPADYR
jgi:hypothetical protein